MVFKETRTESAAVFKFKRIARRRNCRKDNRANTRQNESNFDHCTAAVNEFNDEPLHCWRNKSAVAIVLTGTAADDPANGTQRGGDAGAAIDPHSSMCVFLKVEISFDTNRRFNRGVRPRQSSVRGFY